MIFCASRTRHALPRRSLPAHTAIVALAFTLLAVIPASARITRKQVKAWRAQIRRALYIPTPLPPLRVKNYGSFSPAPGVIAERVTYASEFGLRIPAIVYRPAKIKGRIPGLVVVNGHGANKTSWYSWYTGVLYAKAGAVVVTYDPIGEGERNDYHKTGADEYEHIIHVPTLPQRMGGMMITDVMQGVAYLRSLPSVDPHRIGVIGFSMGSFVAALTGAVDPNFHALFLTGGGDLDGPGGYWDSSQCVMTQSGPYKALRFLGDRGAVLYTLNARRGPTFIFNGTDDTVVAIPTHGPAFFKNLRQRTIALNGSSKNVFTTYFDPGASHRPAWVLKPAAEWLEDHLHFANWTPESVKTMPVIKIGTWAAQNGVYLNSGQRRPNRDAGLEAINVNVPRLTPQQLDVFTMAQWRKYRDQLVYSVWAKDAVAAAQASKPSDAQ